MSTLKVNAIEKKDADQTLTVKDAAMTGVTTIAGSPTVADMSNFTFPTGHVLQIKSTSKTNGFTTGSTTPVIVTDLFVTITPSVATNKILVFASLGYVEVASTASGDAVNCFIHSSKFGDVIGEVRNLGYGMTTYLTTGVPIVVLDSPNTTSPVTYSVYISSRTGSTVRTDYHMGSGVKCSAITVLEIAG